MGILVIDSNKDNLERYKRVLGEEGNHFVAGLNDSLMLLESVYEFDLALCNYSLADATGKDLHENFRMLPETEKVFILFTLDAPDESLEAKINKMSLAEVIVAPSDTDLALKIEDLLQSEPIEEETTVTEESPSESPAESNQFDFDELLNKTEEPDNQIDFDTLMDEINNSDPTPEYTGETAPLQTLDVTKEFSSNLSQTPISDILKHIIDKNHTAIIELNNELSEEFCTIKIKNKQIVHIEMEDFDVEDALFWVLNWDAANVDVYLEDFQDSNCAFPIEEILEEVINKRSEFEELSEMLPDLDTILTPVSSYDPDLSDLEQEYKKVIELFNGAHSINDVIALVNDDNIYTLTIISQLYMDEILISPEAKESTLEEDPFDDEKLNAEDLHNLLSDDDDMDSQDDIDSLLDDNLLSEYISDEDEEDENQEEGKEEELKEGSDGSFNLNTEVLEANDNFEELNKEEYISGLVESFKEDEEIVVKLKPSPFKIAIIILFLVNLIAVTILFTHQSEPKKIIINNIKKDEKIIKKVEVYHLGLKNKVKYIKSDINLIQSFLKEKVLNQKKEIEYEAIFEDKKLSRILKQANFYFKRENYKKAISLYKKLLKVAPNENKLLLKLAAAHYGDQNNAETLKILEKLDFLKEKSLSFTLLKAQTYQATNDLVLATKYYKEFLKASNNKKLNKDIELVLRNIYKNTKVSSVRP